MKLGTDNRTAMLIGGRLVAATSGEWIQSVDPATEEVIGWAPAGSKEDVDRAVTAAKTAAPDWARLHVAERAAYLRRLSAAIEARADEILAVEVPDTGNVITPMRGDIDKTTSALDFYAGAARAVQGETPPGAASNLHITLREPYGVVGRIVPFNHPFMFLAARAGAPLVMGNTLVVKAPETSPLSAHIFSEICQELLPPGVVNVITGYGMPAGDALVRHPDVKRIAFTGSTATGMAIQRAAAEVGVKALSLELGGKNPMIVFADADFDRAVAAAVSGMNFGWQGQSCGSTSRVFVHASFHGRFVEAVSARVRALKLGDPMDPASEAGPMNSKGHYQRVLAFIDSAYAEGARATAGGKKPKDRKQGYWIEPTVFDAVTPDMRIARDEVFGPVLSILSWTNLDEVISVANGTSYGLTAAIWTCNIQDAIKTARAIKSGFIWINGTGAHYYGVPFGGFGNSGTGREECLEELESYTELKSITFVG